MNAISHNLILVNRGMLLNPSAFVLGVPGSGKSMLTKMFILLIILSTTNDQVLIYDPLIRMPANTGSVSMWN